MLIRTRTDKVIVIAASTLFAVSLLAALGLQYKFGEVIFFKRVIAGIAGCF
ncbi:MAG: hypothetical protein ACR2PM_06115 [Hyphomicrobiales bacterium]